MTTLNLLQINANNSTLSHDLAKVYACKYNCSLTLVSEPNNRICSNKFHIYTNPEVNTAIIKSNRSTDVLKHYNGQCFTCIATDKYVIYCCYISPNTTIQYYEDCLNSFCSHINSIKTILTRDFNAKTPVWGGQMRDARGELLLEFAQSLNLNILNNGKTFTLTRPNGCSYVDITMISGSKMNNHIEWSVLEDEPSFSG